MGEPGQVVFSAADGDHGVESQQCQVGCVIAGEALIPQVGMDAAQPPQAPASRAQAPPVRQLDGVGISHHRVGHRAPPVDENPDLAPDLAADGRQFASEFLGQQPIGRDAPPEKSLEGPDLAGLEAVGVSVDLDWGLRLGREMDLDPCSLDTIYAARRTHPRKYWLFPTGKAKFGVDRGRSAFAPPVRYLFLSVDARGKEAHA